jgi:hypothetical protein
LLKIYTLLKILMHSIFVLSFTPQLSMKNKTCNPVLFRTYCICAILITLMHL